METLGPRPQLPLRGPTRDSTQSSPSLGVLTLTEGGKGRPTPTPEVLLLLQAGVHRDHPLPSLGGRRRAVVGKDYKSIPRVTPAAPAYNPQAFSEGSPSPVECNTQGMKWGEGTDIKKGDLLGVGTSQSPKRPFRRWQLQREKPLPPLLPKPVF